MQNLIRQYNDVKGLYDRGESPMDEILIIVIDSLNKLNTIQNRYFASVGNKNYWVYELNGIESRPYLPELFITDNILINRYWHDILNNINPENMIIEIDETILNKVLYTAINSFAICIDLWSPGSRKTPGTFFEILVGSILSKLLPAHIRSKHTRLLGDDGNLSTDIVFSNTVGAENGENKQQEEGNLENEDIQITVKTQLKSIVFPVKISTRERVVQPFAHQLILDKIYGEGKYESILICVSETQRMKRKVQETCVPDTIKLFQKYIAKLTGLYYLDPPERYLCQDLKDFISVGSLGCLLTEKLPELIYH